MHQRFFLEHLYTEVFIISFNIGGHQLIEIYTELYDVMESLNPRNVDDSKNIKVIHGCLLPATTLPSNFNGVDGFIVVNLLDTNYGLLIEDAFHNSRDIAMIIQTIVDNKKINIENTFILYGVEIALTLSISEDEVDEELIERSSAIVREIRQIEKELLIDK